MGLLFWTVLLLGTDSPVQDTTARVEACLARYDTLSAKGVAGCINTVYQSIDAETRELVPLEERWLALVEAHPGDPWLWFYLARIQRNTPRRPASLARCLDVAARVGDWECEALARMLLVWDYQLEDNPAGMAEQMAVLKDNEARFEALALDVQLTYWDLRLRQLMEWEGDLDAAQWLISHLEARLPLGGDELAMMKWQFRKANLAIRLNDLDQAAGLWAQCIDLAHACGQAEWEMTARGNLLSTQLTRLAPTEAHTAEVLLAAESLDEAARGEGVDKFLPVYVAARIRRGEVGTAAALRGLVRAQARGDTFWEGCFLTLLAALRAEEDAAEASFFLEQAQALSAAASHEWLAAGNAVPHMQALWALQPPDEALAGSLCALEAMEHAGKEGMGDMSRVMMRSAWTEMFYLLAGELAERGPAWQDAAFTVMERLRARVLADHLMSSRVVTPADPVFQARIETLEHRIAALQQQLMTTALGTPVRKTLEADLHRLELEETRLQHDLKAGEAAEAVQPGFANLDAVRAKLRPGEAMVSFQLAHERNIYGEFAGGSWVYLIQPARVVVRRLPNLADLHTALQAYIGLFPDNNDPTVTARAGAELYRRLFGDLPDLLDGHVRDLVVVPDGLLHRLPFAALRPSADAPPLGTTLRLSLVPSASLWLHWRERTGVVDGAALVLADPELPYGGADGPAAALGPLPSARREGRMVVRRLGRGSRVWEGAAASEAALKAADLSDVGVLHFAAHAEVDPRKPHRGAVFTAPGNAVEDGLLQPREIAALRLTDKMVVLSTCRSAGGMTLKGEGVMSLARAFMQAGARTVVATLWPLRDDEAALFFDAFYTALGEGTAAAEACRTAQARLAEAGVPARAWAGVVLMGEGSHVPYPGKPGRLMPAALVLLLVPLVWWVLRRRNRTRAV